MRNKIVLLLAITILLLSFFAFNGSDEISGFAVKERVLVTSRFIEIDNRPDTSTSPVFYTDQNNIKRGGKLIVEYYPQDDGTGALRRGGIYDSDGVKKQQVYICPGRSDWTECENDKIIPITISKNAYMPGEYAFRSWTTNGELVELHFNVHS